MKEFIFCFFIFLLFQLYGSLDFTSDGGVPITYTDYKNGTKVAVAKLEGLSNCKFLYVWIDEAETELRVRTRELDDASHDQEWNDIHLERYRDADIPNNISCPHCHLIGIKVDGVKNVYFNLTKEFKDNGIDFNWLKEEDVPNWISFKKLLCNETDYYTYDASRDSETKYRPGYHHTPFIGWMNDPNGLVYETMDGTGYYHLFYQFNPYSSKWDNMHWGHSKTKDFLNWIHLPPAIYRFQKGHIFSGSVAFYDNRLYAFFTVFRKVEHNERIFEFQHNYIAMNNNSDPNDPTTYYDILDYEPHEYGRYGRQFKNFTNPFLIPEEEKK